MSACLFLHSTAVSCDTAEWNDHSQPESPWRNNLVKSKANKFNHHCQFSIHYLVCVCLSYIACFVLFFYFSHTFMFGHTLGPASFFLLYFFSSFIWLIFDNFVLFIPIMLGLLRSCLAVNTVSAERWMNEREVAGRGKEKVKTVIGKGGEPVL